MCSPRGRSSVETSTASQIALIATHRGHRGGTMRVSGPACPSSRLRHWIDIGADQLDGLVLRLGTFGIRCARLGHGPPRRWSTPLIRRHGCCHAVLLLALGVATRRIWPRAAFVATVVGVGIYLATGRVCPIFFGTCACVYAMASGARSSPISGLTPRSAQQCHHYAAGRRCWFCSCR